MKAEINVTSEQIVKKALRRYETQQEDADLLLANVINDMHANTDAATVIRTSVTNSIRKGIERLERESYSREAEFVAIGQMFLFDELIPEHNIPASLRTKSCEEVDAWNASRSRIDLDNAEESAAHTESLKRKASRSAANASASHKLCEVLRRNGIDPSKVTYEEAIEKAQEIWARNSIDAGSSSKKPLR